MTKNSSTYKAPNNANKLRAVEPVICYPTQNLPAPNLDHYAHMRDGMQKVDEIIIPPRLAKTFHVPVGHFLRIISIEGPQVGDLNLWSAENLNEKFYTGKTRALHGTHLSTGDHLWSSFPYLRPMASITADTLDWYGFDEYGGSVHDVIGTRCDPYTAKTLSGVDYHHCCHSNLCRALAQDKNMSMSEAENYVHDVLNVFMCTGFTKNEHLYFMKASPVRPGDYLEILANIPLYAALSACPGGDCSTKHSSEEAKCYPLSVEIWRPKAQWLKNWRSPKPCTYHIEDGLISTP